MGRNNEKVRRYRRLRRKAKRLKKQKRLFQFLVNRILPFALFQFFFKKYSWITICTFLLVFFSNFMNKISTEQSIKFREYESKIQTTKNEINNYKAFTEQQSSLIQTLQKEICEELNKVSLMVIDMKIQNRLQWLYRFIDRILIESGKKKFK